MKTPVSSKETTNPRDRLEENERQVKIVLDALVSSYFEDIKRDLEATEMIGDDAVGQIIMKQDIRKVFVDVCEHLAIAAIKGDVATPNSNEDEDEEGEDTKNVNVIIDGHNSGWSGENEENLKNDNPVAWIKDFTGAWERDYDRIIPAWFILNKFVRGSNKPFEGMDKEDILNDFLGLVNILEKCEDNFVGDVLFQ